MDKAEVSNFHSRLKTQGRGAKDWSNSWTEHEYLGLDERGRRKFGVSIGRGHRVFKDKEDGQWKKRKLTDERPAKDYILIQGAKCCVEVYPRYAKYFDVQHEEVRLHSEKWLVQRWRSSPGTWQGVRTRNPILTVEEGTDFIKVTVTYETSYGPFMVEYFQRDECALKHNVYFTNTSGGSETFRVLQRWVGIVGSKCNGKGFPLNIDKPGFKFHRADKPEGEFIISENLWGMVFNPDGSEKEDQCLQRPVVVEAHAQGMKVDFIYGDWILSQDERLEIDPRTSTLSNPAEDGYVLYDSWGPTYFRLKTGSILHMEIAAGHVYYRSYVEWNITSIPDSATITDVVFKYHGKDDTGDAHIHEMMGARPTTSTDQQLWTEAGEGTIYAAPAGFPVLGPNQQVDLGAQANTDLQNSLAANWFAIGVQPDAAAESQIYSEEWEPANPKPTLYVVFTAAWSGKIMGVTDPAKICGVPYHEIAKVMGITG